MCAAVLFGIRRNMRKVYILSMEKWNTMEVGEALKVEDFVKIGIPLEAWNAKKNEWLQAVDEERRKKVLQCRNPKDRMRSLGAGLLLQYAVSQWEMEAKQEQPGQMMPEPVLPEHPEAENAPERAVRNENFNQCSWIEVTVEDLRKELLVKQKGGRDLRYHYNSSGKPFLEGIPLYFSLSHSGNYVLCGVSEEEIGVDIQEERTVDFQKMSRRFFTEGERSLLEEDGQVESRGSENGDSESDCCGKTARKLFYRLWTQKEAYGKLTGGGLSESMGVSPALEAEKLGISLAEYEELDGYCVAACWKT